ncbi:nuclear transport factor 2 family protein [Zoogloea sp.]|uniref:nuclear transport factor 2 family protein n=1 Tax=Zoogloea sp. TaxID=49181 RepID=UPI0026398D49|nr:nuclear transport factor 2 family protein [Zoogloea sp.]MDD3352074.1 nuclear transport factor 2 family protein [Zoogloea sp.]
MDEVTLDTLLDEARIGKVLMGYAEALDRRDWPALEQVFTADATAHYTSIGHFEGREAIIEVVRQALSVCGPTQHLIGTVRIAVHGDGATARCYLQAIHAGLGDYRDRTLTVWGEYRDRLVRRPEGWRIAHRELALIHMSGDIGATALSAG